MRRRPLVLSAALLAVGCPVRGQPSLPAGLTPSVPPPSASNSPVLPVPRQAIDPSAPESATTFRAGEPPPTWPKAAFDATTVEAALGALGIANPRPGPAVLLEVPDIAPEAQPIRIAVEALLPGVDRVALLGDRLPRPLLALVYPTAASPTRIAVTVHLPRTTRVRAYVRSEEAWHVVEREVKLALPRA